MSTKNQSISDTLNGNTNLDVKFELENLLDEEALAEVDTKMENFTLADRRAVVEEELQKQFASLEALQEEERAIEDPEKLDDIIMKEVNSQLSTQLGLSLTDETLLEQYDKSHPETYKEVGAQVMQDPRYKAANKKMKEQHQAGTLKDEYTGRTLNENDKPNLDHVRSRKKLFENRWRKQANLSVSDLANMDENLAPTNEALNKSKGAKSIDDYTNPEKMAQRKVSLKEKLNKKIEKIKNSNKSDAEKQQEINKATKNYEDKMAVDPELMKNRGKKANRATNIKIAKNAVKNIGKKSISDGIKTFFSKATISLIKNVIQKLVQFLKSSEQSFSSFIGKVKDAIHDFFKDLHAAVDAGKSAATASIISEIIAPFGKLASGIRQLWSSLKEAFLYLFKKENAKKPLVVKIAELGKILITSLIIMGSATAGAWLENSLLTAFPFMSTPILGLGSLAGITSLVISSLIGGILAALVIHLINKFIAKRRKRENRKKQIDVKNNIIVLQKEDQKIAVSQFVQQKENTHATISSRHKEVDKIVKQGIEHILSDHQRQENQETNDLLDSMLRDISANKGEHH